jgi:hypothetical protein
MRNKLIILLLLTGIFFCSAAQVPAADLKISHMEVDIWPEYDQPSVLLIFRISFSADANYPARISLRIPASAGSPYSVAMKDLDGLLYDLEYTVIPDGNWNRIEFVTSSQDLQIEFYESYIQESDITRTYGFSWISDYPIDDLVINVQKPKFATIMSILPDGGEGTVNPDDGLTYYSIEYGTVEKGSTIELDISYIKTNDGLSASTVPVNPTEPLPGPKSLWQNLGSILPTLWQNKSLSITGFLLLGALVSFSLLAIIVRGRKTSPKILRKIPVGKEKSSPAALPDKEVYCYQCGKRAKPGDAFCRTCGSKLEE